MNPYQSTKSRVNKPDNILPAQGFRMISVNEFIQVTSNGLYCPAGDFYLDPRRPVCRALISHAHGDHAVPNSGTIYTTSATCSLMLRRFQKSLKSQFVEVGFGETFEINQVRVTFYPAGHMLGSAQILLEYAGEKYLYTGDFKLQADDSCEPFEFVACDHLITETTFADPNYIHPDPVDEVRSLCETTENILLGAYAIGKAQRLTRLISNHCPEKKIYVHPDLNSYHQIYERFGKSLGSWQAYSKQEFMQQKNGVCILPPNQFARYSRNKSVIRYFATGWKKSFHRCDRILTISDHADWNDVLTLVQKSGAKKVYTLHGDGTHLKSHLNSLGIEVKLLN